MTAPRCVQIGNAQLWLGDNADVVPGLRDIGAVVTDPPYGMRWNTDSTRYSGGNHGNLRRMQGRSDWGDVAGDTQPFDPAPWLAFQQVILWGANHYSGRLPVGTTLVWLKRFDTAFESFLSDAEIAWMKGGYGVYCRRDLSMNHAAGSTFRAHPTQKPIGIMEWCVEKTTGTVLDPFMGSGTTGVACARLGRPFIGIECHEPYFHAAVHRITEAQRQGDMLRDLLPPAAEPPAPALDLFSTAAA
jgi:DNA modification methylase